MSTRSRHLSLHKPPLHAGAFKSRYLMRKLVFWIGLAGFFALMCWLIFGWSEGADNEQTQIRAGICGAVLHEAVYDMPLQADLGMLVRRAGGLSPYADVRGLDLETILRHDSIYHIPSRPEAVAGHTPLVKLYEQVSDPSWQAPAPLLKEISAAYLPVDFKPVTVLYIGLPAVYALIEYYHDLQFINFLHIPHSAVLLGNDYRIIDVFFSLGVEPTMKILQRTMDVNIDYYIIQDQHAFIRLIDALGGVEVDIDASFADAYRLNTGREKLSGFYAWEYIRFIDFKRIRPHIRRSRAADLITEDNFQASPAIPISL